MGSENCRCRGREGAWCGVVAALALLLSGCHSSGLPKPATQGYLDEVTAFYVGLAALQVGDDVRADSTLQRATQLAEGEPAGWANWGVLALRQGNFDVAAQRLGRAQKLAPQNDQIHYLLGVLESKRGNPSQAIVELRKTVEINPQNLRALYLLAQEVERQGDANGEAEFQQLLERILAVKPGNPAVLLELGRVAAKRGEAQTLHSVVTQLSARAPSWPPEVQTQWTALQAAAAAPDPRGGRPSHCVLAQLIDARARISPEPRRDTTRCRKRSVALQPLPAVAHTHLCPAAC